MLFPERLQKFSQNGLGLPRGTVSLSPHHPRWKRNFSDEAYLIFDLLRIEALRLYHVGSTSVPGIASKPIIDIAGAVPNLESLDSCRAKLESLGYEFKGEYGIPGRRFCVLYDQEKKTSFVHLHLFAQDDKQIVEHIAFRDYLRRTPPAAQEYEVFKNELIELKGVKREEYSPAKERIISKLIGEALQPTTKPEKILVLLGSAKGGRNTLDFIHRSYATAELELIDLSHRHLEPFVYSVRAEDEFSTIVEKMIDADLVIFGTPIYWYAMTGAMKRFLDRFSDLLSGPGKPLGEALYGKKVRLLATGSDRGLPLGFDVPFSATSLYFGMDYLGVTYLRYR